ncbi:DUF4197 domain-containing protein [Fulvivirga sediminis]|uniref:DUF4197 domain-containing protein n=1 Tax=Fulvivirga sediminis TaxID=2803949 RepID=A0A937K166_9BACT|nr:DUF4197 domain-containing protein [Fulvivirga sediminis]MBL3657025.1 DUF4197 domain-containing protein [Fulvivirga sediminis]
MIKKLTFFSLSVVLLFTISSCEDFDDALGSNLSESEIVAGLKEALVVGTDTSTSILGATNGYLKDEAVKIFLPKEAQPMLENMEKLGITNLIQPLIDQTITSMNRAAEESAALDSTKVIFKDAITTMSITDGYTILTGNDSSATVYLKGRTYSRLLSNFSNIISPVLNKNLISGVNLSTEELYTKLINTYNDGVSVYNLAYTFNPEKQLDKITSNSLAEHATGKALDGLFLKVSEEEKAIRKDPVARVTSLLERVFGSVN